MAGLKNWASKNRRYLKVAANETVYCQYINYEEFVDKENEDRQKIRYFFEVDGGEKLLESQSVALAESMAEINFGQWIKLTRTGEGRSTKWKVEKIKPPSPPAKPA